MSYYTVGGHDSQGEWTSRMVHSSHAGAEEAIRIRIETDLTNNQPVTQYQIGQIEELGSQYTLLS